MEPTERPSDAVERGRDVRTRGVLWSGFWLAAGVIAIALFVAGLFRVLARTEGRRDRALSPLVAANLQRTPPEPRLEPDPLAPRIRMRAEEDRLLRSYGWVDPQAGVVRVPIDRAMDLLAERGLPPAQPMPAAAFVAPPAGAVR